jgi:hypothetical protein
MDQRPGTPSSDAWQPHEPGAPAAPGAGSSADGSTPVTASWPATAPEVAAAGGPPPAAPRSRRILAGAALATGLAVGGAGVAAAVTSGDDALAIGAESRVPGVFPGAGEGPAQGLPGQGLPGQGDQGQAQEGQGMRGPGGGWHHGRGGRGGFGGYGGALHGELVVPQQDGTGTRTITVQSGSVTSVSSTQLVVKSTDGFSSTYVLNGSTQLARGQALSAVKVGHQVTVVASKSGSRLTALRIGDRNLFVDRDGDRDDRSPTPSPSGSPTTSGSSSRNA